MAIEDLGQKEQVRQMKIEAQRIKAQNEITQRQNEARNRKYNQQQREQRQYQTLIKRNQQLQGTKRNPFLEAGAGKQAFTEVFPLRIGDIILAIVVLLASSILLLMAYYLWGAWTAQIAAGGNATLISVVGIINTPVQVALAILATAIIGVYVVINICALVGAYLSQSHPVFAIASILFLIVVMLVANIAVNVFQAIISQSFFTAIVNNNLSLLVLFFQSLPVFVFLVSLFMIYLQAGKPQQGQIPL